MNISDLIQPRHLSRKAVLYVRQSSPHQVAFNQESQRLQYALKERAQQLGWPENEIVVIDSDLGHTAATTEGRVGFQQLAARIALGEIGILIAYDATRLARNCSHWYQLLDLCGRTDCLIADRDGVYDPSSINGRLLLGLKGQISELELHTLRARLTAGILSKARRGELALTLPTGLVRREDGQVVKHPDREVVGRLELVFQTLLEQKSLSKVVRHFRENNLMIPRRNALGDIDWKRATVANLGSMVQNPAYGGAFVYGRTRWKREPNAAKNRGKRLPIDQWRICIHDKYPAFITWETYLKIQQMLRDNYSAYDRNKTRGVARDGKALAQGIAYCGECGHKLVVQYKHGTRYLCNHLRQQHGEPVCQWLPADRLDDHLVKCFLDAVSAVQIDLANQSLHEADQEREQLLAAQRHQLVRLRYQARLAERQYQHVDPENRLIAAELEARWEAALRELTDAEEKFKQQEQAKSCWAIPADLITALKDIGQGLPEIWRQGLLRTAQKKSLLRAFIDKVVLHRIAADRVRTRIVWRGGATTTEDIAVPVGKLTALSGVEEMVQTIVRMANEGDPDARIAEFLTANGHRSPHHVGVLESTVRSIRLSHGILRRPNLSHPCRAPGYLTIPQIAQRLGLKRYWIHDRIHNGTIRITKPEGSKCYLFPDKPDMLRQLGQLAAGEIQHVDCRRGY